MSQSVRRALIKKIIQKGVELAKNDPSMQELLRQNSGESMLFYIEDLKAPFGIEITGKTLAFTDNPDLNKHYNMIATCNEDTLIYILKGMDPADAFFYGLMEVQGKGWFKRIMILKRILKLGETRGLKQKVVSA